MKDFRSQVEGLRPYLLRYASLQLRDAHAAEDAVQEALVAALAGEAGFGGRANLRTWLTGILKHKIVDAIRRTGRGILYFADGGRYEGDFVDGKMQGRGLRVWSNGTRYEGEWRNDMANGYGTKSSVDGQVFTGTWTNGCFRQENRWSTVGATPRACGFE